MPLAVAGLAAAYAASWILSGSPLNGLTVILLRMLLLGLAPAWAYFSLTGTLAAGTAVATACALYAASAAALCLGFGVVIRRPRVRQRRRPWPTPPRGRVLALATALALYCVFAVHHVAVALHVKPFTRAFYVATRLGWGSLLFTAQTAALIVLILGLLSLHGSTRILSCSIAILLLASFGAKGPPVTAVVVIAYVAALRSAKIGFARSAALALAGTAALYAAFWFYSPWARGRIVNFYLGYNASARNLIMEIGAWRNFANGRLEVEDALYDLVPRSVFPSKPIIFGERRLAGAFFPGLITRNQGDPSFGEFGLVWADFGQFSFFPVVLQGVLQGMLLGLLELRLRRHATAGLFITYLTLAGLPVFAPGGEPASVVLVNLAIAAFLELLLFANAHNQAPQSARMPS